ncbi:hypothetical protein NDU88_004318 [Pleurodeles waltl]|uniref:Uncharacterized protein n=1 Tax=Pleurodeles waltl TaxID=8319 RepID=A0AAV7V0W9_PLEWA|nr:hypothetical protein NDU88_004318 [Pleurodeles waltl]
MCVLRTSLALSRRVVKHSTVPTSRRHPGRGNSTVRPGRRECQEPAHLMSEAAASWHTPAHRRTWTRPKWRLPLQSESRQRCCEVERPGSTRDHQAAELLERCVGVPQHGLGSAETRAPRRLEAAEGNPRTLTHPDGIKAGNQLPIHMRPQESQQETPGLKIRPVN